MREARAALYAALMKDKPHSPDNFEMASKLIDDFAHALASQQRARGRELRREYLSDAATQFEKAADLIDPKAVDRG